MLASLPAEWTDLVPDDPFVVLAGGRSPFHIDALLELSELIEELKRSRTLNPHPEAVVDEAFGSAEFFDARDLV